MSCQKPPMITPAGPWPTPTRSHAVRDLTALARRATVCCRHSAQVRREPPMSPTTPLHPREPTANHAEGELRAVARSLAERLPAIQVLVRPSFQPLHAYLWDFSAMGLAIICERFLQPGAIVAIQLRR